MPSCRRSDIFSILGKTKSSSPKIIQQPMFVEDMVPVPKRLRNSKEFCVPVESENMESIHNHSAYAMIEYDAER